MMISYNYVEASSIELNIPIRKLDYIIDIESVERSRYLTNCILKFHMASLDVEDHCDVVGELRDPSF